MQKNQAKMLAQDQDRPVGPTGRADRSGGPVGRMFQCISQMLKRSDQSGCFSIDPTGRTDRSDRPVGQTGPTGAAEHKTAWSFVSSPTLSRFCSHFLQSPLEMADRSARPVGPLVRQKPGSKSGRLTESVFSWTQFTSLPLRSRV